MKGSAVKAMGGFFKGILFLYLVVLAGMPSWAESLYQDDMFKSYVTDERAYRIGDMVTLFIVEAASAESSKDTASDRNMNLSAGFAKNASSGGAAGGGRTEGVDTQFSYGSDNGKATARKGRFRAKVTVEVKELSETGKLFVTGQQRIVVNGEEQVIRASGWLRRRDIDQNNTALSLRLSDARIEYVGHSDEENKGLIRNVWGFVKKIW